MTNIAAGKKKALRHVLDSVKNDVRSVTGRNLRYLKIKTSNFNEKELNLYDEPYKAIPNECLSIAKEIVETKCGDLMMNIAKEEVDDIANFVCGS